MKSLGTNARNAALNSTEFPWRWKLTDLEGKRKNGMKTFTLSAERLAGDANEDGKVDMLDALRVVQYVKGKTSTINLKNADVTGDGKATIEDARLIGQWAAGWNVGLK